MIIDEKITDASALNSHSYTIEAFPANTFDRWSIERATSMRNTTVFSYSGMTVTARPKDTTKDSWDTILVELYNSNNSTSRMMRRTIDLNIYYRMATEFRFADGYPSLVNDSSFGAIDVGLIIGEGYEGYDRVLIIASEDELGNVYTYDTSTLVGSYETTPYVKRIYPNIDPLERYMKIDASITYKSSSADVTKHIEHEFILPADESFSYANGYPSLVDDSSLGAINVGLILGDGYPRRDRNITIVAKEGINERFRQEYTVTSGSYSSNPYVVTINPTHLTQSTRSLTIDASAMFVTPVGEDIKSVISSSVSIPCDEQFEIASGYPQTDHNNNIKIGFNIGDGWYNTPMSAKILYTLIKDASGNTVSSQSYYINGGTSYKVNPYVITLYDSTINLKPAYDSGSITIDASVNVGDMNDPVVKTISNYNFNLPAYVDYSISAHGFIWNGVAQISGSVGAGDEGCTKKVSATVYDSYGSFIGSANEDNVTKNFSLGVWGDFSGSGYTAQVTVWYSESGTLITTRTTEISIQ